MIASLGHMYSAWWAEARRRIARGLGPDSATPTDDTPLPENRLPVQAWLVGLGVSALLALILTLTGAPPIVRAPVTITFLMLAPGRALVRLATIPDAAMRVSLMFALSVSVVGLVTLAQAYGKAWNPTTMLLIVILITLTAAVAELAQLRRRNAA